MVLSWYIPLIHWGYHTKPLGMSRRERPPRCKPWNMVWSLPAPRISSLALKYQELGELGDHGNISMVQQI